MSPDVLIIGYGPTGATLAARLGQLGVKTLIIDREHEIYPLPRAAHFDHEIMRVWQRLGIAAAVEPQTRAISTYDFVNAQGQSLMRFESPARTLSGWQASYMFHQPGIEAALRNVVAQSADVQVETGVTFLDVISNDETGATVSVMDGNGTRNIRTRYVIACDGASSPVRKALGIPQFDYGFDEPWLVVDVMTKGDDSRLPQHGIQHCVPARPTTYMPMSPGRYRWEFMLKRGEVPADMMDDSRVMALLAPWHGLAEFTLGRKAVYRFHGLVAREWRKGNVLLAGDAAHQTPPFMGQGLCSGVRDAENLGWKLAEIFAGRAADTLLGTYQPEREPHVRAMIETAIFMGRVVCIQDEAEAAKRDRDMLAAPVAKGSTPTIPPAPALKGGQFTETPLAGTLAAQTVRHEGGATQRSDDHWPQGFVYAGFGDAARKARAHLPAHVAIMDLEVDPWGAALAAQLSEAGVQGALIRPDRYILGTGPAANLWPARTTEAA